MSVEKIRAFLLFFTFPIDYLNLKPISLGCKEKKSIGNPQPSQHKLSNQLRVLLWLDRNGIGHILSTEYNILNCVNLLFSIPDSAAREPHVPIYTIAELMKERTYILDGGLHLET